MEVKLPLGVRTYLGFIRKEAGVDQRCLDRWMGRSRDCKHLSKSSLRRGAKVPCGWQFWERGGWVEWWGEEWMERVHFSVASLSSIWRSRFCWRDYIPPSLKKVAIIGFKFDSSGWHFPFVEFQSCFVQLIALCLLLDKKLDLCRCTRTRLSFRLSLSAKGIVVGYF